MTRLRVSSYGFGLRIGFSKSKNFLGKFFLPFIGCFRNTKRTTDGPGAHQPCRARGKTELGRTKTELDGTKTELVVLKRTSRPFFTLLFIIMERQQGHNPLFAEKMIRRQSRFNKKSSTFVGTKQSVAQPTGRALQKRNIQDR